VDVDHKPAPAVRLLLGLMGMGLFSIFLVALWLTPNPQGFGTHQQLGLPACQFRKWFGVSCPHCGMTTSFANVVRGDLKAALYANPMGIPLSITWACCIPWCLFTAVTGRWIGTRDPFRWIVLGTILYLILAFVLWAVRIVSLLAI
jgi:hypothetical protein